MRFGYTVQSGGNIMLIVSIYSWHGRRDDEPAVQIHVVLIGQTAGDSSKHAMVFASRSVHGCTPRCQPALGSIEPGSGRCGNSGFASEKICRCIAASRSGIAAVSGECSTLDAAGTGLFGEGRKKEALVSFQHALRISPDSFND
jgi:hypothetical protein